MPIQVTTVLDYQYNTQGKPRLKAPKVSYVNHGYDLFKNQHIPLQRQLLSEVLASGEVVIDMLYGLIVKGTNEK